MSEALPAFSLSLIEAERQSRFDPLRNFKPEKLVAQMDAFRCGRIGDLARTMEAIEERDDTLMTVIPKAKSAVARHGWDIIVGEVDGEEEKKLAEKQKKTLRYFYNNLRVSNALDQDDLGGVSLLLRQMMDAKGKRWSNHNIVWRPNGRGDYTATLWHLPLWFFENMKGKMRFIAKPFGYEGEDMEPGEWLVTRGLGISIASAVSYTYKQLALKPWVIYSHRHGMPGVEGVTDAAPGSKEWKDMETAVAGAAANFRWVRNRTNEIKAIQLGANGELPMPALVERMDRALASLWRGADLSTISAGAGQGQGASLQGEESETLEQDDAQWLSETLNLKLDRLVLDYVYGEDVPALAYFQVRGANKQHLELDLKIDAFALENGHPVGQRQFAERYSRPAPDKDDILLQPSAAPAIAPDPAATLEQAANEARQADATAKVGQTAIFKAAANARDLAARRPVFREIASRLAALVAINDEGERRLAAAAVRTEAHGLYTAVLRRAPDLAQPAAEAIGAAIASGMAEQAAATTSKP